VEKFGAGTKQGLISCPETETVNMAGRSTLGDIKELLSSLFLFLFIKYHPINIGKDRYVTK